MKVQSKLKEIPKIYPLDLPKSTVKDISLIVTFLNPRKAADPDCIPLQVIQYASNIIDAHLCNIIIKDVEKTSTQKSQKQH